MSNPEAGWYPDGSGLQRYWDGNEWTEHTAPLPNSVVDEVAVETYTYTQETAHTEPAQPTAGYSAYETQTQYQGALVPQQSVTVTTTSIPMGVGSLDTNRSLVKYILLGLITLNLYSIFVTARAGDDLNTMASRWDHKRTMNFWLVALLLGPITLGIMYFVWYHGFATRIGQEQLRRGLPQNVTAADFWLWGVLGSFIIVGPFIFAYKWLEAMNGLCENYNTFG